jgi:DNA-binding response OmpR family regulator
MTSNAIDAFHNSLTATEQAIIAALVKGNGTIVPRAALLAILAGRSPRTLDTYIKQIRAKLRACGLDAKALITRVGVGYGLRLGNSAVNERDL